MNKIILLLLGIFFISLTSSSISNLGTFAQNQNVTLIQTCNNCTYNNITYIVLPNSDKILLNNQMTKDGTFYNTTLNSSYTNQIGNYIVNGIGNPNGLEETWNYNFEITPAGKSNDLLAYIILLLFFSGNTLSFYLVTRKINYERWYDKILRRYENKNIVRVFISGIGYNLMKNSFIWYYLLGLLIMLNITEITLIFGIGSMIDLMEIILGIYYFGALLVALFLFGNIQEWVMKWIDDIKSLDMGVK